MENESAPGSFPKSDITKAVARAFANRFPQIHDAVTSYDAAIDDIVRALKTYLGATMSHAPPDSDNKVNAHISFDRVRVISPDQLEFREFISEDFPVSYNQAVEQQMTYRLLVVADILYSVQTTTEPDVGSLPNALVLHIPIAIGSRYSTNSLYDPLTLQRSGEDMEGIGGWFVVDGKNRFIIPTYDRAPGQPLCLQREFGNQIARTDVHYSAGGLTPTGEEHESTNSYYLTPAILENVSTGGRGGKRRTYWDYVINISAKSDPRLNRTIIGATAATSNKMVNLMPIRYLFYAFGCTSDYEMMRYIDPSGKDEPLHMAIQQACLYGYEHSRGIIQTPFASHEEAGKTLEGNMLKLTIPLTREISLLTLGYHIFNTDFILATQEKHGGVNMNYFMDIATNVMDVLTKYFMPGINHDHRAVCVEIGSLVSQIYRVANKLEAPGDPVSLETRRVRTSGAQLYQEIRRNVNNQIMGIVYGLKRIINENATDTVHRLLVQKIRDDAVKIGSSVSSDLIAAFKGRSAMHIYAEQLEYKSTQFVLSKIREIAIQHGGGGPDFSKNLSAINVHQSHLFFVDPSHTAEGKTVGRYQLPTIFSYTAKRSSATPVFKFLQSRILKSSEGGIDDKYVVKLNGIIMGYIEVYEKAETLYADLMQARREEIIPLDCSVTMDHVSAEIKIWTDDGRMISGFINVENSFARTPDGKISPRPEYLEYIDYCIKSFTSFDLEAEDALMRGVRLGFIDLISPDMACANMMIAPSLYEFYANPNKWTHLSLPMHANGIIAGSNPAITRNKAVRSTYVTNHVKQAISVAPRSIIFKGFKDINVAPESQLPLLQNATLSITGLCDFPFAAHNIVAFLSYKHNQEDAITISRSMSARGTLSIEHFTTMTVNRKSGRTQFGNPPTGISLVGNPDSYSYIDPETSLPYKIGQQFKTDDAVVTRVTTVDQKSIDSSVVSKSDDVGGSQLPSLRILSKSVQQNKEFKVVVVGQHRDCYRGDKFASEQAQKGTIGRIAPSSLMPYTSDGLRIERIFNPEGVFKRETGGHMHVALTQMMAAYLGCPIECTPGTRDITDSDIITWMDRLGYDSRGYQVLWDPLTHQPYRCMIFVGLQSIGRQKHMVMEKAGIRNGGPRDPIYLQPVSGYVRGGGSKIDSQTKNGMQAGGLQFTSKEMCLYSGSSFKALVCRKCGYNMGYCRLSEDRKTSTFICPACGPHEHFIRRQIPVASINQQIVFAGMGIDLRFYDHDPETDSIGEAALAAEGPS